MFPSPHPAMSSQRLWSPAIRADDARSAAVASYIARRWFTKYRVASAPRPASPISRSEWCKGESVGRGPSLRCQLTLAAEQASRRSYTRRQITRQERRNQGSCAAPFPDISFARSGRLPFQTRGLVWGRTEQEFALSDHDQSIEERCSPSRPARRPRRSTERALRSSASRAYSPAKTSRFVGSFT